jgi:hypothetical protein
MELFIQIRDGQPYEHPIFGDNFRQAFPDIDPNNLPPEFARFERVPCPSLVYATLNSPEPTYQWVGGFVKDVWDITPFTPEQIKAKQDAVKAAWAAKNGFASWVFDEEQCNFVPPVPRPTDGKRYRWDEASLSWVEIT